MTSERSVARVRAGAVPPTILRWDRRATVDVPALLRSGSAAAGDARDDVPKLSGVERLADESLEADLVQTRDFRFADRGGDRDRRDSTPAILRQRSDLAHERVSVFARHADVAHDHVRRFVIEHR